ncbi:YopX protein [Streptococcus pneumoniae]|uniref:YopX family protein n=1 Tax=Streptococcus pneumoniae TaxID=1313 RepID=UPI0005E6A2C2|nr:YopX family protein [Streptococcus pneumoniae]MDS3464142.1 hypothetical protein [Streptococcus pneumoniae]MDS4846917.1 hypothetical protein [Streptococcus pneumoniae]MDS5340683.1 hypothetical protein [Streptococcus pneumoniae]MDT5457710.1 hypothetical protein [Streptococcus pneumoniae]MDT5948991.1 hypothetical protein [Streptococcus pneumoniae]
MIPKFRVWVKIGKRMVFSDDILAIDYENKKIVTQQVYFESGLAVERDIYCYDFDDIELMQSTGLKCGLKLMNLKCLATSTKI